jgi:hypothetical protein
MISSLTLARFIFSAAAMAWMLSVMPVLVFLHRGWSVRRDKLLSYLNLDALTIYYDEFPWTKVKENDLTKRFRKQFNYLYGRRTLLWPMSLFIVITAGALFAVGKSVSQYLHASAPGWSLPQLAVAALLGAFMWSISDELDRLTRRDLGPKDIYGWAFRVLLSVPFGWALSQVAATSAALPVAFLIGAFPTQTLFRLSRRIAVQKLGLGDQGDEGGLEVQQLQSVSRRVAEAFEDEGIDTISSLAWADPVDLTIRTNLDFNYVLDCMSQALLWVYFQEKTKQLYPYSLRGSQEVTGLVSCLQGITFPWDLNQVLTPEQARAKATLTNISANMQMSEAALLTTLHQVSDDPYTIFISKVWH